METTATSSRRDPGSDSARRVLQAVNSAYNSGFAAEATFTVGEPTPAIIFMDGFESDLSGWSAVSP